MTRGGRFLASNDYTRREKAKRFPRKRILIVSQGQKTEPNYFRSFRVPSLTIECFPKDPERLVKKALELKQEARKADNPYDRIWVVFDRDATTRGNFLHALAQAQKNKIDVAYSVESFEIWFLLHFHLYNSSIGRQQYLERLSQHLGAPYEKNSPDLYERLLPLQPVALKNARRLLESYSPSSPFDDNPSTTVFRLVEILNENR